MLNEQAAPNPSSLPRVLLRDHQLLPDAGGIYFALDGALRVWYIGKATEFRKRLPSHERLQDFDARHVTHFGYVIIEDATERDNLERRWIDFFDPPLNDLLRPPKLPVINLSLSPDEEVNEYIKLRDQMHATQVAMDRLKANIVSRCEENGGKWETASAKIYLMRKTTWKYTDAVSTMEKDLLRLKRQEELDNRAEKIDERIYPAVRLKNL
jgi:hypothetical protein